MKKREEQLSAFLDDALDAKELQDFMQDLKRDPVEDAERLQRYQLASNAMRDELDQASFMDISAAVHRAIEQEDSVSMADSVPQPGKRFNLSAWLRPVTGLAIAASVAMATVTIVRTVQTDSVDGPEQLVDVRPVTATGNIIPVNPLISQRVRVASTAADVNRNEKLRAEQLSEYMMKHSEYAGQTTMQGMMPYARVVSFDPAPGR